MDVAVRCCRSPSNDHGDTHELVTVLIVETEDSGSGNHDGRARSYILHCQWWAGLQPSFKGRARLCQWGMDATQPNLQVSR